MLGDTESETLPLGTIDGGNKVLANTGTIKFYGKDRSYSRSSRLQTTVSAGEPASTVYKVASDLDWVPGDELYFAPTAM